MQNNSSINISILILLCKTRYQIKNAPTGISASNQHISNSQSKIKLILRIK